MSKESGKSTRGKYVVEAVTKALDVLEALEGSDVELTLTEVASYVQLSPSSTFRLLHTLEQRGWVERTGRSKKFRRVRQGRLYKIAWAMLSSQFSFSLDVTRGIQEIAARHGVHLSITDNCLNADVAILNAQMLVKEKADVVIQCQAHERVAPIIAHLFAEADIPCIAVDIPQPGAVYFGANNYEAGLIAGRALGTYAAQHWQARIDKLLLLELPQAGPMPQARMTGTLMGVREILGSLPESAIVHLSCKATFQDSLQVTLAALENVPQSSHLLIGAINDPSAVGAVRALEASARVSRSAVVGQNCTLEARVEMRKPNSCLIGSVAYFPEKYGEQIIPLALRLASRLAVPTAVYVEHRFLSRANVNNFYPSDPEDLLLDGDINRELPNEAHLSLGSESWSGFHTVKSSF
jgi:ribose transport system substrate-binding protein